MPAGRAARSTSYLILLRGGFAMRASFQPRRWSLTPPFHHFGAGSFAPFGIRLRSLLARLSVVCFLWHFPSRAIAARLPPLTSGPSALRSPDFPLPCGSDRSLARHFRRNFKDQRYRMRPHIVHATMFWGLPASPSFSFASTICDTLGGWTRWHPSHTPSCVSATTTGQRFVLRRS